MRHLPWPETDLHGRLQLLVPALGIPGVGRRIWLLEKQLAQVSLY